MYQIPIYIFPLNHICLLLCFTARVNFFFKNGFEKRFGSYFTSELESNRTFVSFLSTFSLIKTNVVFFFFFLNKKIRGNSIPGSAFTNHRRKTFILRSYLTLVQVELIRVTNLSRCDGSIDTVVSHYKLTSMGRWERAVIAVLRNTLFLSLLSRTMGWATRETAI